MTNIRETLVAEARDQLDYFNSLKESFDYLIAEFDKLQGDTANVEAMRHINVALKLLADEMESAVHRGHNLIGEVKIGDSIPF